MSEVDLEKIVWKKQDRDIQEGEIVRTTLDEGQQWYANSMHREWVYKRDMERKGKASICVIPEYALKGQKDGYLYGVATGGFGMRQETIGNAIFVDWVSNDIEDTYNQAIDTSNGRWERYWGVELSGIVLKKKDLLSIPDEDWEKEGAKLEEWRKKCIAKREKEEKAKAKKKKGTKKKKTKAKAKKKTKAKKKVGKKNAKKKGE